MKLLEGKKCLVMGVLNEKSIAWGIVQEMANQGAELCMTYLGDAGKKRVVPLAEKLGCNYTLPCDVSSEEDMDNLFADIEKKWGKLDCMVHCLAFSDNSSIKSLTTSSSDTRIFLMPNICLLPPT